MHVSEWIRTSREERGLTREEFAKLFNFSASSIKAWEDGEREPSAVSVVRLSATLDFPESLQVKGASFSMQDGQLSVHKGVYAPPSSGERTNK